MSSRSVPQPLPLSLLSVLAGVLRAGVSAWTTRRVDPCIELSERTLDDIGAPDWLRVQARVERDDGAAWLAGRQAW